MWGVIVAALAAALVGANGGSRVDPGISGQPLLECVHQVRFAGADYEGVGPPDRAPELTGRTAPAIQPGCNDTGEAQDPPDQEVLVEEISGIPMTIAVWNSGGVLVRRGETLPASTQAWYGVPTCDLRDPVLLTGSWLGVMSEKKVRFDGDLRTPLRIDLRIERGTGNPPGLEGYTLRIHDDGGAHPALDKRFAQEALWSSRALLEVEVTCDRRRYVARGFSLRP